MNELLIKYGISGKLKVFAIIAAIYFFAISAGLGIYQALQHKFDFFFYVGAAGALLALLLILTVTVWQTDMIILLNNEGFRLDLPAQKVKGTIFWENVTHVGIGLSYLTIQTNANKNYKIDLENLKYKDLRDIKTKLIEICEAKKIPYNNV
ncbi:MAG: hypothetical protein PHO94_08215 [Petrimonas sp.]|nr:hypothetical protein [Petrimonas sp.]